MNRHLLLALACYNWLLTTVPAYSQSLSTLERWGRDMQEHAGQARPQLLTTTLRYVKATTPDEREQLLSNYGGILGFYQTWLAANPTQRPAFQQALARVPGPPAWHQFLLRLTETPAPNDPLLHGPSPSHNDYLWGSYFATGQPVYLDSLVAQCRYAVVQPASADLPAQYSLTGSSAIWSLQSNARRDAAVAAYLRQPHVIKQLAALQARWDALHPVSSPASNSLPH